MINGAALEKVAKKKKKKRPVWCDSFQTET